MGLEATHVARAQGRNRRPVSPSQLPDGQHEQSSANQSETHQRAEDGDGHTPKVRTRQ